MLFVINTFLSEAPAPRTEFFPPDEVVEEPQKAAGPPPERGILNAVMAALENFPEAFRAAVVAMRAHCDGLQPGVP